VAATVLLFAPGLSCVCLPRDYARVVTSSWSLRGFALLVTYWYVLLVAVIDRRLPQQVL
jgi:hypothetical protein